MLHKSKASHLGPNMSVVEMLIAMYGVVDCAKIRDQTPDRARIIVSKGHCAAATYAILAHYGVLSFADLETYCLEGSKFAGHVSHAVHGVEHSTGALGHGLNVAVGCAVGLRTRGLTSPVLTLVGDGELQEGAIWEGLMFACHHKLSNLVVLVDNNGISSITHTAEVIDLRPLSNRFAGFGAEVFVVNGHNVNEIDHAIRKLLINGKPGVIVCNTVKGKNVPFAEDQPMWHYRSLTDELYAQAMAAL